MLNEPFEIWTKIAHSKSEHVWISDPDCICEWSILPLSVPVILSSFLFSHMSQMKWGKLNITP